MIEIKDIEKLASLSRIKLNQAEKEQMQKEISSILGYVDQIAAVSGNDRKNERADKALIRNVFREDASPHESGKYTEAILHNAPARQGNYLKVKKIL